MFYQQDGYVPTEYGTRECAEHREPCGAFYGMPFSGEVEEQAQYDREQIQEAMPCRWFSKRDELKLARLRGEEVVLPEEIYTKQAPEKADPFVVIRLCEEFNRDTNAPADVRLEYRQLARRYAKGERHLLSRLHDLYTLWISRR